MADENVIVFVDYADDVAEAKDPPKLPSAEYVATVSQCNPYKNAETGTEGYKILFRIAPEQFPANFDAEFYPDGKSVTYVTWRLNDDPMGRSNMKKLRNSFGIGGGTSRDPNQFVGLSARIRVAVDKTGREKVVSIGLDD